jgi:CubicO group peptidase (beta-lactamase class C family)
VVEIEGYVAPGFEAVRQAFSDNFQSRGELGAACAVYRSGKGVVDLWGGFRDRASGAKWGSDTMVLVYSSTKGMAGLAIALAHSRGLIDYDALVCTYWPEFSQAGKEQITVRQLLAHQGGLAALDARVDRDVVADPDLLAEALAAQRPAWTPGARQGYHNFSLGFYESELIRRVDPKHRTIGQFFQDEIAAPLGLDFFIRLPADIPNDRLATIEGANPMATLLWLLPRYPRLAFALVNPRSISFRAMMVNPGPRLPFDPDHVYARDLEVPSGGGVGTARALARAYDAFGNGGSEVGLRADTLEAIMAPVVPPSGGFYDLCMKREMRLSLGFLKPSRLYAFGSEAAFGAPGAGGSFAFADPTANLGYAYVTNRMGVQVGGDPRELAVRRAVRLCAAGSAA